MTTISSRRSHHSTSRRPANIPSSTNAELARLSEADTQGVPWRRWGPYLAERQWGTVREDYSEWGDCWNYFPHDHARSRAYRWGEDGLLGISDDRGELCFALALWNHNDPILKERLFGLTGPEGNHGEDVKEHYFYLDSTPTHSYMKALYKYPQAEFPYARLAEGGRRGRHEPELELSDTGVFNDNRYFDVHVEYAKAAPDDIAIRITLSNRADTDAPLDVLPTLWFRNTWSWSDPTHAPRPSISRHSDGTFLATYADGRTLSLEALASSDGSSPTPLFTENESNSERLWNAPNRTPYVKDAFHRRVINGDVAAVNPAGVGTKGAAWYRLRIAAKSSVTLLLRLRECASPATQSDSALARHGETRPSGRSSANDIETVLENRLAEADAFYAAKGHDALSASQRLVARQAAAGLLWSKQFYYYDIAPWIDGDAGQPAPPGSRRAGRNAEWRHLNNADIISMPDKWEYPWYAAWDLAFQMIPFAKLDPQFAKDQLVLMLREWYMHPNGQLPAYEFAFGDVNPPVHAWACWRVYKMTGERGKRDRAFLERCFQKLLLNFNWWVNRKDPQGRNLFAGGFLGLDNIGVFDRSRPLPTGGHLEQADGTAWMAFYCGTMLSIALELAGGDGAGRNVAYEDMATKFFEHFVAITDSINTLGGTGLWDDEDGFYYDRLLVDGRSEPLRVRSLVGVVPLLAVEVLEDSIIARLPDFKRRLQWFIDHRKDLPWHATCACAHAPETPSQMDGVAGGRASSHRLLALPTRERLIRVVSRLLDESEFLSPHGVRSVSKFHERSPYVFRHAGEEFRVDYTPGESTSGLFGGNSNWRGPIWFPLNFLLIEALERYHHYYADTLTIPLPGKRGERMTLQQAANEIRTRLTRLFLPDAAGNRPCHGSESRFATDPHWKDLVYFYEHFHGDTGRGLGATHQTGWTALVMNVLEHES